MQPVPPPLNMRSSDDHYEYIQHTACPYRYRLSTSKAVHLYIYILYTRECVCVCVCERRRIFGFQNPSNQNVTYIHHIIYGVVLPAVRDLDFGRGKKNH